MLRANWATRFGFYLVAIGSACGLGNLWRFPYVVGENGGGAFVLLYLLVALIVGLPLLIGELTLGQTKQASIVPATKALSHGKFFLIGYGSLVVTFVLLAYYAVISSWVLYFFIQFLVDLLAPTVGVQTISLAQVTGNTFVQVGLTSVHLIFCMVVVARGVQEGIERWIGALIPVFAVLLFFLIAQSLALPTATEALRFLFYPDFSSLNWSSLAKAIGHVCFTLSIGFGTMVTFGSYLRRENHVPTVGFRVTLLDTSLSLAAGLLIFPIALSVSNVPLEDPGLLFEALPSFLLERRGGYAFGAAFFLCLYLAALGASVGLFEVIASNLMSIRKCSRVRSTAEGGVLVLAAATIMASLSPYLGDRFGWRVLVVLDSILVNWLLPCLTLGICWICTRGLSRSETEKSFLQAGLIESEALYPHWRFMVRWGIPVLVIVALILQAWGLLFGR